MKRGRSTSAPTKAQARRFIAIQESGCIACRQDGRISPGCEIHHQNLDGKAGQKRLGHDHTIGLCPWHHRGVLPNGWSLKVATATFGPSLAVNSNAFRERYGDDERILILQNSIIGGAA